MLIIRKHGIETIATIKDDEPLYVVPDELLMHKGILHVILVSKSGRMYEARFLIDGEDYCPKLDCVICKKAITHFSCIPSVLRYSIVVGVIIITGLFLIYLKFLIKACYSFIYGFCIFGYILYRLCRGTLRFSVIYGALLGD